MPCKFYLWRKTWLLAFFFLKYLVYTLKSRWLQCWTENIFEKFENVSASLNLENIFWFSHLVILRLKLWNFFLSQPSWFGLRIFSKLFYFFSTRHLKLRKFFVFRSYLSWTLKIFWNFFKPSWLELDFENFLKFFNLVWLELDFENFLKFFQTQLTWTGLWKFFKFFSTLN